MEIVRFPDESQQTLRWPLHSGRELAEHRDDTSRKAQDDADRDRPIPMQEPGRHPTERKPDDERADDGHAGAAELCGSQRVLLLHRAFVEANTFAPAT